MNSERVYHDRRASSKKMPDPTTILAAFKTCLDLLSSISGLLSRKRPKLGLVHRIHPNEQGVESACTVRLLIQNTGKSVGRDILVQLKVVKPLDAHPGYKLFFNDDIGCLESYQKPGFLETDRHWKPQLYSFRLKPDVFVNPGTSGQLQICRFIAFAVEDTQPSVLDHDIGWGIHSAGQKPTDGRITIDGALLKQKLLKNLYDGGRVVGYEIPSGRLPEDPEDSSGGVEK